MLLQIVRWFSINNERWRLAKGGSAQQRWNALCRCEKQARWLKAKAGSPHTDTMFLYAGIEGSHIGYQTYMASRHMLAKLVNAHYSYFKIQCGGGQTLDVVFVPRGHDAAAVRFPLLLPGQELQGGEECNASGITWSCASRNAGMVLLTQDEDNSNHMHQSVVQ